ncbi:MAG: DUF1549 domain-containing protein [Planctomycetota bacterium]
MRFLLVPCFVLACAVTFGQRSYGDEFSVYPPQIDLSSPVDRQAVIAVVTGDDGVTEDVTARAAFTLAHPERATIEGNIVLPLADGKTELEVIFQGKRCTAPIEVSGAGERPPVSFKLDVMPIFMRAGCNAGGCHGSARGQDGFRLSLFGYDPDGDYFRITRELGFRRVNLAVPSESLLLEKATGAVPHTGGKRFDTDSQYYRTLFAWLEAGAPMDAEGESEARQAPPKVVAVEVFPPQAVLEGAGATQQLVARAKYSDGSDRDVTSLAVFLSNNDNSASVSPDGLVTAAKRGEAFVMARYDTYTVGSQVLVLPQGARYEPPEKPAANYIDALVEDKLRKLRVSPSGLCDDSTFLRRASIDIIGLLPTEEETEEFLADSSPDKRAELIDRLVERKEFSEVWAMQWAELLMIRTTLQFSTKSALTYADWLADQIDRGVRLDEIVRSLLATSGGTFDKPAASFYEIERDTLKTTENVAQLFMGIRVQCAQCHNHPFDRWTMDDYYGFAAFFGQIGRKPGEDYRETIIFNRGGGEVRHPVGNRVMPPKFLGGDIPDARGRDRRELVAEWLTSPENPYFATSVANRVWAHFFGTGIVEPVDDVRISNPPSNPELYAALGEKLVEYEFDFRRLVRDICNSNAYQRTTVPNDSNVDDLRNFARQNPRRMRAEVLLDCVSAVTETEDKFRGLPAGTRAVQIADGAITDYFLTTFGRSPRETVCAGDVQTAPTLSQSLHLLNGDTLERKIRGGAVIDRWLKEGMKPAEIIDRLYLRCLSRKPAPELRERLLTAVDAEKNTRQALEDVFWAILNSREFVFNH